MEEELGAPMYRAVVVKKLVTDHEVELHVRYHRKSIFDDKRKIFKVLVDNNAVKSEEYLSVNALKPGDELFVDPYGEGWCDPMHYNYFYRKLNLYFA